MGEWWTFLGRLHVATVHFPIALLLVGGALDLLDHSRDTTRERAARTMLLLGAIGAAVAAALGWIHASAEPLGSSVAATVERHRWIGVGAAVLGFAASAVRSSPWVRRVLVVGAMAAVAVAGHLGGELTHGSEWFVEPLREPSRTADRESSAAQPGPERDRSDGLELGRDVLPIFRERCVSCHGEDKHKGDLRLDRVEERWFEQGELGTSVIVRGDPSSSEIVRRLELPLDDEDHMPPAKKPQLAPEQIAAIRLWIEQGAR
jgi:mono/diheme cytochrome c family protein